MPTTPSSVPAPTVVVFDKAVWRVRTCAAAAPARARPLCSIRGQTIEGIDAIVLSGGSAFGLDSASGVQAYMP